MTFPVKVVPKNGVLRDLERISASVKVHSSWGSMRVMSAHSPIAKVPPGTPRSSAGFVDISRISCIRESTPVFTREV